jgi:hypothetical protein
MSNPVKARRTMDAGSAQPLHEVVQTPFELALAHPAAHHDEALAPVPTDAPIRRLCDGPNAVWEGVARENPAPVAGSAGAPLRGPLLLPAEWILARHATSWSANNRVLRLTKPLVPDSQGFENGVNRDACEPAAAPFGRRLDLLLDLARPLLRARGSQLRAATVLLSPHASAVRLFQ